MISFTALDDRRPLPLGPAATVPALPIAQPAPVDVRQQTASPFRFLTAVGSTNVAGAAFVNSRLMSAASGGFLAELVISHYVGAPAVDDGWRIRSGDPDPDDEAKFLSLPAIFPSLVYNPPLPGWAPFTQGFTVLRTTPWVWLPPAAGHLWFGFLNNSAGAHATAVFLTLAIPNP